MTTKSLDNIYDKLQIIETGMIDLNNNFNSFKKSMNEELSSLSTKVNDLLRKKPTDTQK